MNEDDIPDDFKAFIAKVISEQVANKERDNMNELSIEMEITSFIGEMSLEHLLALRKIIMACASNTNIAHMLSGFVTALMVNKYGTNWDGKSPESELLGDNIKSSDTKEKYNLETDILIDKKRLYEKYNITADKDGRLRCKGCGVYVHSIEDRMRRNPGPEGCVTCQHKTKWG